MTLVVSLRIPDGLVLAADSQSTTVGKFGLKADIKALCPSCKNEIELKNLQMPPLPIASSTHSFAQKLFPFKDKFGVASFGAGILNKKTIFYHVENLQEKNKKKDFETVSDVAEEFKIYFDDQLKKQIPNIEKMPKEVYPLGFQIVGYDNDEGKTKEVLIGNKSKINEYKGIGCTVSGDRYVVSNLWDLKKIDPGKIIIYETLSLQDAVDYAEFLIETTARYQRFANIIPTVGGEIDVALITPFRNFVWIKRKKLMETLEKQEKEE